MKKATLPAIHNIDSVTLHEPVIAHRYENMGLYISLITFLAMATIFLLILSL